MKLLTYFLLGLLIAMIVWHFLTIKYINPYTMDLYIANKGAGKSTQLAKNTIKAMKRGWPVYTNANDLMINNVRLFETFDLGHYYVHDAYLEIDEVSLYFDNRNFKNTSKDFIEFLREVRHDKLCVDLYTQSYDCDKKIRTMCDNIYIGTKWFRVLTVWRRLRKNVAIKEAALDAQSQIVDALAFTPWWQPGSIKITYIPRYIKYFNSFKPLKNYTGNLNYRVQSDAIDVVKSRSRGAKKRQRANQHA